jgi:hypothetical protein
VVASETVGGARRLAEPAAQVPEESSASEQWPGGSRSLSSADAAPERAPLPGESLDFELIYREHFDFACRRGGADKRLGPRTRSAEGANMIRRNLICPCAAVALARVTSATALGLCATLLGCSNDSINMGEGVSVVEAPPLPSSSRCQESPVLRGEVVVRNQAELDALEGCEVIDGDLYVDAFEGAHLRALHALTSVSGLLSIGATQDPVLDGTPQQLDAARQHQELQESGWLASLEGLEALESAGSLTLIGLASDLKPLAQLRMLVDGSLSLAFATNLRNFDGLQNLVGLRMLSINAALRLDSFDGLTLPSFMAGMDLTDVDLRQLKPLAVTAIDGLYIEDTQVHDLAPFASLQSARAIQIVANQKLESLTGLENILRVEYLDLDYNRYLVEVPDFEKLWGLQVLRITGSPLLARLPAFQGMQVPYVSNNQEQFILGRPDVIELEDLGSVTTFSMPAGWSSASVVRIQNNANLRRVDFTGQTYIDYLSIQNNPLLENLNTGVLDKVNVLEVVDNPRLSMATFGAIRHLDMTASGNADAP